jgi:hypothetical protein
VKQKAQALYQLLKEFSERHARLVYGVSITMFGLWSAWFLALAGIGFWTGMVPTDAIDRMTGQPVVCRWLDEAVLGIPVSDFYTWSSLLAGIACLVYTVYCVREFRSVMSSAQTRACSNQIR